MMAASSPPPESPRASTERSTSCSDSSATTWPGRPRATCSTSGSPRSRGPAGPGEGGAPGPGVPGRRARRVSPPHRRRRAPKDIRVLSRLGRAQLLRGETKAGIQTLESAVASGRASITLTALGDAQLASDANAAAERTFAELVKQRGAAERRLPAGLCAGPSGQGERRDRLPRQGGGARLPRNRELADGDADLRAVRGDPRYAQLFSPGSQEHAASGIAPARRIHDGALQAFRPKSPVSVPWASTWPRIRNRNFA